MVCTMGCVHTILRDGRDQFKMGSPGAYIYSKEIGFYEAFYRTPAQRRIVNFQALPLGNRGYGQALNARENA